MLDSGPLLAVSSMLNFTDAWKTSNALQYGLLSGKCPQKPITQQDFLDHVKCKRTLVLVHGYANSFDSAYNRYVQDIIPNIGSAYDQIVCFFWPGGGGPAHGDPSCKASPDKQKTSSFLGKVEGGIERGAEALERSGGNVLGAAAYPFAEERVKTEVSSLFAQFLGLMDNAKGSVDILAHSMGCRVVLSGLSQTSVSARNVYLAGAAVGNKTLDKGGMYYLATKHSQKVYVFYSNRDGVLHHLYPAGEVATPAVEMMPDASVMPGAASAFATQNDPIYQDGLKRLESQAKNGSATALGYEGPKGAVPQNVVLENVTSEVSSHHNYFESAKLFKTIRADLPGFVACR